MERYNTYTLIKLGLDLFHVQYLQRYRCSSSCIRGSITLHSPHPDLDLDLDVD